MTTYHSYKDNYIWDTILLRGMRRQGSSSIFSQELLARELHLSATLGFFLLVFALFGLDEAEA